MVVKLLNVPKPKTDMHASHLASFISLLCIDLVALVGNICMIIVGLKYKPLRRFQNAFIFNVALADLLQSALIMPSSLVSVVAQKWLLGRHACDAFAILKATVTLVSLFSLSGISLQRYFFVVRLVRPLDSTKYTAAAVAVVWLCSFCLSVTPLFGWGVMGYSNDRQVCTFFFHKTASHTLTVFTLGLFINVLVMIFCYSSIFLTLRTSRRSLYAIKQKSTSGSPQKFLESSKRCDKLQYDPDMDKSDKDSEGYVDDSSREDETEGKPGELPIVENGTAFGTKAEYDLPISTSLVAFSKGQNSSSPSTNPKNLIRPGIKANITSDFSVTDSRKSSKISKKELRLLKTIFVVVAVFVSCWLPYVTFNLLRLFSVIPANSTVDTLTMWLGFLNSAANPVLYGALNTQFRQAMKQVVLFPIRQLCSGIMTKKN